MEQVYTPPFANICLYQKSSLGYFHGWSIFHSRMMHVQAVDKADLEAAASEISCDIEEAQRFGPKVIGRKIVYPGIDEDQ